METKKGYPGMFLGYTYDYSIGDSGVYRKDDKLFASISGDIIIEASTPPKISIKNELTEYIPRIGDEVYMKITKVTKYVAMGDILALKSKVIRIPVQGLVKYESVKSNYRDFEMTDCFVPNDIILCRVISIDQSNYIYLSTQDPNHGVVFARSPFTNNIMMPISFDKMMCLDTKMVEGRKVAKPLSLN